MWPFKKEKQTHENFNGVGINGKNSEFHAAMGLAVLPYMPQILARRAEQHQRYQVLLAEQVLSFPDYSGAEMYNHSFFPLIFPTEEVLKRTQATLESKGVHCRRYFYPTLNKLDYTTGMLL